MKLVRNNTILFTLLIILVSSFTYANEKQITKIELLNKYMHEVREKKPISIDSKEIISNDQEVIFPILNKYTNDESSRVKNRAYALIWQIGKYSKNNKLRMRAVESLLNGCNDPDPLVWQHTSKWLLEFNEIDFSSKTKDKIKTLMNQKDIRRETIRIVGIANIQDFNKTLEKLLIDESKYELEPHSGRWYGTVGWAARLALARMGNKKHILHAIKIIELEPNNVIRVTVLLKNLGYIKQPEIVKILQNYLESNERLPSVKNNVPGTLYSQYALGILTNIIVGFPVKNSSPGTYSQEDINNSINWLKKQNSFEFIK